MSNVRQKRRQIKLCEYTKHEGCVKCAYPILIIDDGLAVAKLLEAKIRNQYGYATITAGSLHEAEQVIKASLIHLAISDLNLPDAPNGEIIDLLSKHHISTIALTSAFGEEMREKVLKKGVIDYIPKQSVHALEYAISMANRIYENHHIDVLIVDDSLSSRTVLENMMKLMQFNVNTARNGEEALIVLTQKNHIKLALIDYEMSGMNGFELIHEIRKKLSKEELAIIGISASDKPDLSARFLKTGANDFIRKPFSYEEILCRVGQNLEVLELIHINREAAFRDYLTGLYNRRYFFEKGSWLYAHAENKNNLIAAMVDIDHFKKINDIYGHHCGDLVLKEFAKIFSMHFQHHLAARVGGEEFAVFIKDLRLPDAQKLFETFRMDVESLWVECEESSIAFTVSIGLTDNIGATIDEFIKAADLNLYKAKMSGRNRVVY